MGQTAAGALKVAAGRIGVTVDEYTARLAVGDKWCMGCRRWRRRAEFWIDRTRGDGLASKCVECHVARRDNPARPGKRERRLRAEQGQAWCRGCADWLPVTEVSQGACRVHLNEQARAWYAENRAAVVARKVARRRRLAPVPDWWRIEQFELFGGLCAYGCGRPATALDHIWPVARGGVTDPGNLAPICTTCNSRKSDHDPAPWVDLGLEAFPWEWFELMALANLHNCDQWIDGVA